MKKKILTILTAGIMCVCSCFAFSGCNIFDSNQNGNDNTQQEEKGFTADVGSLKYKPAYGEDSGFVPTVFTYTYQCSISGNLNNEALYNVTVQIAFYVDGDYAKTKTHSFNNIRGQESAISQNGIVNFDTNLYNKNQTVTAKVVKVTWQ